MSSTIANQPRFIANPDLPQEYLSLSENPEIRIQEALVHVIGDSPPQEVYTNDECRGLFRGPTSLAYLLLKVHATYPDIKIRGQSLRHWATAYITAKRIGENSAPCGLACESAAFWAVKTILDATKVLEFQHELERLVGEEGHPYELLFGYAGLLYMVRAVESWVSLFARL
ncbi:hypothetical protein EsH8_X_000536 [Colletotrichum jinshuiense]